MRFNENGSLDFQGSIAIGASNDYGSSVAIQNDGTIAIAGYTFKGSSYDFALLRYNSNLSLDSSFGDGGIVTTDFGGTEDVAYSMALQSDGKIVVAGTSNARFAVARYNGGIAVPEPSTGTLLILSIPALFGASRRCRPDRIATGSHTAS